MPWKQLPFTDFPWPSGQSTHGVEHWIFTPSPCPASIVTFTTKSLFPAHPSPPNFVLHLSSLPPWLPILSMLPCEQRMEQAPTLDTGQVAQKRCELTLDFFFFPFWSPGLPWRPRWYSSRASQHSQVPLTPPFHLYVGLVLLSHLQLLLRRRKTINPCGKKSRGCLVLHAFLPTSPSHCPRQSSLSPLSST